MSYYSCFFLLLSQFKLFFSGKLNPEIHHLFYLIEHTHIIIDAIILEIDRISPVYSNQILKYKNRNKVLRKSGDAILLIKWFRFYF